MISAWWQANMDARRSISLLIAVAGSAVVAFGMAASPMPFAFGTTALITAGAISGAGIGEYRRRRVSDPARAQLWGLASGALVAASLVAMFGMAVVIRPTIRGIPGLEDAWAGIFASGLLVEWVGAVLWERDARRRRFVVLLGTAFLLIAGGVFVRLSGDAWALLGTLVSLGGFGVMLLAFEADRRSSRHNAASPDTWR